MCWPFEWGVQKHKSIPLPELLEFLVTSEAHVGAFSSLSGRRGYASYLSFSVINTRRNPSLLLFSGLPCTSWRARGDIFRVADSVSYQTAEDQLSMSYTFHYTKEELEMNEGVRATDRRRKVEMRASGLDDVIAPQWNRFLFGDHPLFCCVLS